MNLLIVDDNEQIRRLYELELSEQGHTIFGLSSGLKTMELIYNRPSIDLVILDIKLQDMNGLDLLQELRSKYPDIPVIINSAYPLYKSNFISWLADAYLIKSPNLNELKQTIKQLLTDRVQSKT